MVNGAAHGFVGWQVWSAFRVRLITHHGQPTPRSRKVLAAQNPRVVPVRVFEYLLLRALRVFYR